MTKKRIVIFKRLMQILCFVGILIVGSLLIIATGGNGGGDGNGDDCAQLAGVWMINVPSPQNNCPGPALQGIWDEDWTISLSSSMMTLRIGNSDFLFEGPLTCNGSSFSYTGVYRYPDIVDPNCIYTATLSLSADFSTEQQFIGSVTLEVFGIGGICDPGIRCQTGGSVTAVHT